MVTIAVAALTDLCWALTPLTSMWAVHEAADHGGWLPGVILVSAHVGVLTMMALTHAVAWAFLAVWLGRAAGNARVLGLSRRPASGVVTAWLVPSVLASAVARAGRRRRPAALVWSWWLVWLAGMIALLTGTALTWPAEVGELLGRAAGGATVDVDRAGELLGYQIAGRLPGAVLLLAAAVLGIMAVTRVTRAQQMRIDERR
jgi:hypothetical protein